MLLFALFLSAFDPDVPPRFWKFERDALFPLQMALAQNRNDEALTLSVHAVENKNQVTRYWSFIYRGVALDRAGRREEALASYASAVALHKGDLGEVGLAKPLTQLEHLDDILRDVRAGTPFTVQRENLSGVQSLALVPDSVPPAKGWPLVLRIGHPRQLDQMIAQLRQIRRHMPKDEPFLFVTTDILTLENDCAVDAADLVSSVPKRFSGFVDALTSRLPVDRERIYLTGFSFDGVWAWMLGYAEPLRYAAVAALSSVSYPKPIQEGIKKGTTLPVCVLRGAKDPLVKRHLVQETSTGEHLVRNNPSSIFKILPNTDHSGVENEADQCLQWLARWRRGG